VKYKDVDWIDEPCQKWWGFYLIFKMSCGYLKSISTHKNSKCWQAMLNLLPPANYHNVVG